MTTVGKVGIHEQLNEILANTMENIEGYDSRDLATITLGMAKIVKQVNHGVGGKRTPRDRGTIQKQRGPFSAKLPHHPYQSSPSSSSGIYRITFMPTAS